MRHRAGATAAALVLAATASVTVLAGATGDEAPPDTRAAARPQPTVSHTRTLPASRDAARSRLAPHPSPTPAPTKAHHSNTPRPRVSSPTARPRPVAPPPAASPREYARAQVGSAQFPCLDALWNKESGWNPTAQNPTSSAYGIPQANPGSKMASVGSDWHSNPITQIRWGLGYIRAVYGTPCAAWKHSQATNWY